MTNKIYTYQIESSKVDSMTKLHTAICVTQATEICHTPVKTVNQPNKKMTYNHIILLPKDHRDDCACNDVHDSINQHYNIKSRNVSGFTLHKLCSNGNAIHWGHLYCTTVQ